MIQDDELKTLITAIHILPAETAKVIELLYVNKKSLEEIKDIMGRSMSIIYNHHNRGVFLLRRHLAKNKVKRSS